MLLLIRANRIKSTGFTEISVSKKTTKIRFISENQSRREEIVDKKIGEIQIQNLIK